MKINKQLIIASIIVAIVFAGGGFLAGTKYQQTKRTNFMGANGQRTLGAQRMGEGQNVQGGFRGGAVSGEIISSDDKSITVKLNDGSSKIVLLNEQTKLSKSTDAIKTDLKNGEKVMIVGTTNSDGSVTAQNIQLNPGFGIQNPSITPKQ